MRPEQRTRSADTVLVGIEQEFELFWHGEKLDFRERFEALRPDGAPFQGRADAIVTSAGFVLSTDKMEAEVAIAPVALPPHAIADVVGELLRVRALATDAFRRAGADAILGYSTHISISTPVDRAPEIAWSLTRYVAPALILAMETRVSDGLIVRPREDHVEICADYLDDPESLTIAVSLVAGAVRALAATEHLPRDGPRIHRVELAMGRPGIFVPRDAFGPSIHAHGRSTPLAMIRGGSTTAGDVLQAWVRIAGDALGDRTAEKLLDAAAQGEVELPSERAIEERGRVTERQTNAEALPAAWELASIARERRLIFIDWRGAVLETREGYATVPREQWKSFAERPQAVLESLPRSAHPVVSLADLAQPALHADVDRRALAAEARRDKPTPSVPSGGIVTVNRFCFIKVFVFDRHLCPGESGWAVADFWPWGQLVWILPPGLVLLTGQGTPAITFRAIRSGCPAITCVLYPLYGGQCSDSETISVPEVGLITADEQPITCIGIAGHAPGIVLELPVADGSADVSAPIEYAGGDDESTYRGIVRIKGRIVDPLGFAGLVVEASDPVGLEVNNASANVDADGRFELTTRAIGFGGKRVVLRCKGVSGTKGLAVLAGIIDFGPELEAAEEQTTQELATALDERSVKAAAMLFGPPDPPLPVDQAAFDELQRPIDELLERRDEAEALSLVAAVRSARGTWSVGGTHAHSSLGPKSRKRIIAFDCLADPGMTAQFQGHDFKLEEGPSALISTDPEAFVAIETEHDGERILPEGKDILVKITREEEEDPLEIGYRDCRLAGGFAFRVTVEGSSHCLLFRPRGSAPATSGGSGTALVVGVVGGAGGSGGTGGPASGSTVARDTRRIPARLVAKYSGLCSHANRFVWRAAYGPDLNGVVLEVSGSRDDTCAVSASVPGMYLVEVRLISDHDDPLSAAVAEVEALELTLNAGIDVDERYLVQIPQRGLMLTRVSIDAGYQIEIRARVTLTGDAGRKPIVVQRAATTLHWRRFENGRDRDHTGEERQLRYLLSPEAGGTILPSVRLTKLDLTDTRGERVEHDLAPLDIAVNMVIQTAPGKPVEVLARAYSAGAQPSAERSLGRLDQTAPRRATLFEELSIADPRVAYFRLRVLDVTSNPVVAGTRVTVAGLGSAKVRRPQDPEPAAESVFEVDALGEALVVMEVPNDAVGDAIVRIEVGELVCFVGNPIGAVEFELRPDGVSTFAHPGGIRVAEREGNARATVRVRFDQAGVPEGTPVVVRIAHGAVRTGGGNRWRPEIQAQTRANGEFPLFFTPAPHTPDGEERWFGTNTWGDTTLIVQVGPCTHTFTVHFESAASVETVPQVAFPRMMLVNQEDLAWIDPPPDQNRTGPAVPSGVMRAEQGRDVLIELHERLEPQLLARFVFDGQPESEVNPIITNSAPADPLLRPERPCRLAEDVDVGGTIPSVRAVVDDQIVSASGRKSLRLSATRLSFVAYDGDPYAAPVTGSAGFEVSFRLRIDTQRDWEILRVEGTLADGRMATNLGALSVTMYGLNDTPTLIVRYRASGCSRPEARMQVTAPLRRRQWIEITVTVEPSLRNDNVTLRVRTNLGPENASTVPGFNLLAGNTYWLSVGPPDQGEAHVEDIRWSLPRAYALHLRRSDGLLTPWLMVRFASPEMETPVERRVTDGRAAPAFAGSIDTLARFTVGYCDAPRFRKIDVGALDELARTSGHYVGDTVAGFVVGESQTAAGFAADFAAGMLGWGDLRDVVKQLAFLSPGGDEFEHHQFWLALSGLALDVAQLGAPAAAAPNAVLSVLKILIKRLEPFMHLPRAKEIARMLGEVCYKVLRLAYETRLLHGAQAIITIDMIRQAIPSEFWDWFFEDVSQEDLEAVVRFGKAVTPSFDYTAPLDKAFAITEAVAGGDAVRLADLMERLWMRVEVISEFFNPTWRSLLQIVSVTRFLARLRRIAKRRYGRNVDAEVLDMIRQAGNWRFGSNTTLPQAREVLLIAMQELGDALEDPDLSAKAVRGLVGLILGSGPPRAMGLLADLRELGDTAALRKFLENLDDMANLVFKTTDGNVDEKLRVLNRLFSGLYVDSTDAGVRASARLGVEGMIHALRRFEKRILENVERGAINPLDSEGLQLLDALLKRNQAMEVKAFDGAQPIEVFRALVQGCVRQFDDCAYRMVEQGLSIKVLYYCIHITGDRAAALARFRELRATLRQARERLAEFAGSDPDFPLTVPEVRFIFVTPNATTP